MRPSRLLPAALAAACLLSLPASADAASPTRWLCKPGAASNPCAIPLTSTVIDAAGKRTTERAPAARRPKVDCFYVYPTVSDQKATNATLAIDPEQRAIAEYQAARFSQSCRIYAPVYRQLTLQGISTPRAVSAPAQIAYGDVRDAWREYLKRHNKGRGVVLIGHSQGTYMLRQLVRQEIDRKASVRRRLVSALLIGGNVEVRKGADRGGDFRNLSACRSERQLGCVVAYSMFDAQPSPDSRFARTPTAGREVLCTNPASLAGGSGRLDTYSRTKAFPGTIGLGIAAATTLPKVPTPWVAFPGRASARCVKAGGAVYLKVTPTGGADDERPLFRPLDASWGLHLGDMNLAMGNLNGLVRQQVAAYVRRQAKRS